MIVFVPNHPPCLILYYDSGANIIFRTDLFLIQQKSTPLNRGDDPEEITLIFSNYGVGTLSIFKLGGRRALDVMKTPPNDSVVGDG